MDSSNFSSPWQPYQPDRSAPWDLRRVVHLHRRAAFAVPWTELQRDLNDGPQAAVDRLFRRGQHGSSDVDSNEFDSMADTIGTAATASASPGRLKAWWLYRMLMSPDPLGERLTLMWHNHFATSNRKVQNLVQMREQNELLRKHARARFGELLSAVVKHPAMLTWLDADSNRKGHPNENLARELMELFTLGVGNYSEADVQEAARGLTGWTIVDGRFAFRNARHDEGQKTFLGKRGTFTGDDVIELLLEHPATARRVAWRLCQTFMGEGVVDPNALSDLADGLASRELDLDWAIRTVLHSQLFFSEENMQTRVLGPVEYIVGALRALELHDPPPSTLLLGEWATRMGQDLFYPPSVGGWHEGRTWLDSRTLIARANFADALSSGRLWHPTREPDVQALLRRHGQQDRSLDECANWLAMLLWGAVDSTVIEQVAATTKSIASKQPMATIVAQLLARPEHHLA